MAQSPSPKPSSNLPPNPGNILGIVFVAAVVPDAGESLATGMKTGVFPWVKIDGDICTAENPETTFFNMLEDAELREEVVRGVTPQATAAFTTPVTEGSWRGWRCWYVKCLRDASTSLVDQEHMIGKLKRVDAWGEEGLGVVELESDHCPFVCMPERLAEVVRGVVGEVGELRLWV